MTPDGTPIIGKTPVKNLTPTQGMEPWAGQWLAALPTYLPRSLLSHR